MSSTAIPETDMRPVRRLALVTILAVAASSGLAAGSAASAIVADDAPAAHQQVLYRNFCPVTKAEVAAAGRYVVKTR
jgi:hypothetical protein